MSIPLKNKLPKGILYYDAPCLMCSNAIQFLRKKDKHNRLIILPITQYTSKDSMPLDSVVFVTKHKQTYFYSTAVIQCLYAIGGLYTFALIGYCIPKFLRDALYKVVAHNRNRFFKYSTCSLPLNNK
jgi:predicted DCC family thiol-disulfide oxidoreductase YuxK